MAPVGSDSPGKGAPGQGSKRKHRANGKPVGGRRPGAGRPSGARNVLPQGAVAALRALRHRVPEGTPEPLAELADEALETVAQVMRGAVWKGGLERLTAARVVREEVCGPVPKEHRIAGAGGGAIVVRVDRDE